MNRSTRRKAERQIQAIMKNAGDNCSICGKAFPHNSKTFGGLTANGTAALVGECCTRRISHVVTSGLFVSRNYDAILKASDNSPKVPLAPEQLSEVVEQLQSHLAEIDKLESNIMRRAGVQSNDVKINFSDSPWKNDDASWFLKNPGRSHRLRRLFPGEAATLSADFLNSPPPVDHEYQILVRQVAAGKRIRMPFWRNVSTPIPDIEEVIHALFDIISTNRGNQSVISVQEVAELAKRYSPPSETPTKAN